MAGSAPVFTEDGKGLDLEWVRSVLGSDVSEVSVQVLTDVGGLMGEVNRVLVRRGDASESWIFKQIVGEQKLATSRVIGCAREAHFYNSALAKSVAAEIPATAYAYGDSETGEKYLLMEDLTGGVQAGLLYGPGNPNNWAKHQAGALTAVEETWLTGGVTVETVTTEVARSMARTQARFWKDRSLLELEWIRGRGWWQADDEAAWRGAMDGALQNWQGSKEKREAAPDVWTPEMSAVVDASLAKISFPAYRAWTDSTEWSLVHGDFHPANVMWMGGEHPVKLFDWEMVGVGNGAQEIGQYMISHVEPAVRRDMEKRVVQAYHAELESSGVQGYSFDQCWRDYVDGAVGRWAWFIAWMAGAMPPQLTKFFNAQFAAFVADHGVTPENVVQPRV